MSKQIKIPTVGESITEVTIASWLVADGDVVELDQPLAEIESDKATLELPAEVAGKIKLLAEEGDTVEIGAVVCEIDESAAGESTGASQKASEELPKEEAKSEAQPSQKENYATGHASPAARKILDEKGVDPSTLKGSGKDGRVTKADALNQKAGPSPKPSNDATSSTSSAPTFTGERNKRREKMSSLRKTISRRLVEAKNTTAMLTTFNEVDMTEIMALRKRYKEMFLEKKGIGLGFMSLFTKACVQGLHDFPGVNAQIDGQEIIYHDYVDVGIAVSTPKGLVVPIVRNAESMSLANIEMKIKELAMKGRDGKLSIDEMTGGTFTITNGGVFGSMLSTPILNIPQSGILGMHNIVERPIAKKGQVVIAPVMYIALSYDHRIVDGRESVGFLKTVKEMIEDPARMLLEV